MSVINLYSVADYEQTSERVEHALREFRPEADPGHRGWKVVFANRVVTVGLADPDQLHLAPSLGRQIRTKLSRTRVVPKQIRSVVAVGSDESRAATPAETADAVGHPLRSGSVVASRIAHELAGWDTVVVIHDTNTDRLDRITPTRPLNR